MSLMTEIQHFTETYIDLIDANKWEEFYDAAAKSSLFNNIGKITDVLMASGIDPLATSDRIFDNMFVRSEVRKMRIPPHIKSIGVSAFYDSALVEVEIPEGVSDIPMECFEECLSLQTISIPESVTHIAWSAIPSRAVIVCPKDSYAAHWGRRYHINVRIK